MNKTFYYNNIFTLKNSLIVSTFLTLLYFFLKSYLFFELPYPVGDESSFLKVFDNINKNGFYNEWRKGNLSPVFYLIAYPLNSILENPLLSFRVISITSTLSSVYLLLIFAKKKLNINGYLLYSLIIFVISFLGYRIYWQGINDPIFHLIIIRSFYCVYDLHHNINSQKNATLLGILLGLLIGTRFLSLLVIPCYIFFFYKKVKPLSVTYFVAIFIGLLLHSPSLIHNKTIGKINKNPENGLTWSQKNFLSQKKIYNNELKDGSRATWKEVEDYIAINGKNSLPKTFIGSLLKKPSWTIRELFNDFWVSIKDIYFKFMGLGIVIIIGFTLYATLRFNKLGNYLKLTYKFLLFFWLHTFFISFVVLTSVEVRWYTSFIYLSIVLFHFLIQEFQYLKEYKNHVLILNLITLSLFQLKFIFTDYNLLSALIRSFIK